MVKAISNEPELWARYRQQSCRETREKIFLHYYPYARMLAKMLYRDRFDGNVDFGDYAQLAGMGLLDAIERYDPEQGAQFKTYAEIRITGAILTGAQKLSEKTEQIAMRSRRLRERLRSLCEATEESTSQRNKTFEQLIDVAVGMALGFMLEDSSLYLDNERPVDDALSGMESRQLLQQLTNAIASLCFNQREVIFSHYYTGMNFQGIAETMGVTKSRVSQLHKDALHKLREKMSQPARVDMTA